MHISELITRDPKHIVYFHLHVCTQFAPSVIGNNALDTVM